MKRDHEMLVARAWGHEVEQQAQRDGQTKEAAPVDVTTSNPVSSSLAVVPAQTAGTLVDAAPVQDQYPVEYDPFDRPVEEVVMQLFDDDPPANPPPTKYLG